MTNRALVWGGSPRQFSRRFSPLVLDLVWVWGRVHRRLFMVILPELGKGHGGGGGRWLGHHHLPPHCSATTRSCRCDYYDGSPVPFLLISDRVSLCRRCSAALPLPLYHHHQPTTTKYTGKTHHRHIHTPRAPCWPSSHRSLTHPPMWPTQAPSPALLFARNAGTTPSGARTQASH